MRLIHAVRDLAAETGTRIETVALYTDSDRTATFVREADIAYDLGPAANRPYLDHDVLGEALVETGADAAWVGWGFVAEDPAFAELCAEIGVTFVGPSAEAMRKLGDKIGSKLIAEEVGVPVAPWSRGPVETLAAAKAAADRIGYPLMLKATAGGGGRGIRMVADADELTQAYELTRPGGRARVRQRRRVPGAPGDGRPARRGAGDRGRAGHRVGAGRARLLGAAAQPEDHRGVRLPGPRRRAGRRAEGVGRAARAGGGLPGRGHRRVPLPPRRAAVRVPGGEHAPAGRAPDHRDHHRRRPGEGAAARRGGRQARRRGAARSAGTPSRRGSTPRTPTATSPPPPAGSPGWRCPAAPASGWTPGSARATRSPPTSTR